MSHVFHTLPSRVVSVVLAIVDITKLEIDEQRLTNIDESLDKVVDCLIRETYFHRTV